MQTRSQELAIPNHESSIAATLDLVKRFEDSFNRHDIDAVMADMTDDCVVEFVAPVENGGGRWEGQAAVRAVWASLDHTFPGYAFATEDVFACGERCAYRWILRWTLPDGTRGSLRGADLYTVRGGKVARKVSYFAP
jgi:ketosteroid isomerase-like protein